MRLQACVFGRPFRIGQTQARIPAPLYIYGITKSFRLLYGVDRRRLAIRLVGLDDHKNLYGKD